MRQILSIRFLLAVGAVVGLFFLLTSVFAARDVIDGASTDGSDDAPDVHRIDFVDQVFTSREPSFAVFSGVAAVDTELVIDGSRSLRIVAGTPGIDLCPEFGTLGACAVVADLLGEGVVWFALVPMGPERTVEFPAIDVLDGGWATLVNGWQLPYAPILDRRCRAVGGGQDEFESYREFRQVFGDDFISIYDLDERRLTAVECRARVPYAPESPTTTLPDEATSDGTTSTPPVASTTPVASPTTVAPSTVPQGG